MEKEVKKSNGTKEDQKVLNADKVKKDISVKEKAEDEKEMERLKQREYMREYRKKNPEKVRRLLRESYRNNDHNERQKKKYHEDEAYRKDKIERAKKWNAENAEKRREYIREYMREYRKRKNNNND